MFKIYRLSSQPSKLHRTAALVDPRLKANVQSAQRSRKRKLRSPCIKWRHWTHKCKIIMKLPSHQQKKARLTVQWVRCTEWALNQQPRGPTRNHYTTGR